MDEVKKRYIDFTLKEKKEYHRKKWREWMQKNKEYYREKNNECQKRWRIKNPEYYSSDWYYADNEKRRKRNVRMKINNAIHNGKVKRGECVVCGADKAEAHHPDYNKPYDVVWLCKQHHRDVHNNKK